MNDGTMVGDVERFETRIMVNRIAGTRSIAGVWVVNKRIRERVAVDGTRYDMDYGIANVIERITFEKRVGRASKEVKAAIDMLSASYPTATVEIY